MIAYITILFISAIYALIRAKHDSFISNGRWKTYAFLEGVYVAILSSLACHWTFGISWGRTALISPIFAFVFWIIFDGMSGIFRAGKWFYFGSGGFDQKLKAMFLGSPLLYMLFKIFWLFLTTGAYFSL